VSSTDFHTTNLVDVNWTVTVINTLRLPLKLLMTLRIPSPAHRRGHKWPWRMGTNFWRRGIWARDFSTGQFLPTVSAFVTSIGCDPLELFRTDLLCNKTKVPVWRCLWDATFSCFDTIQACDRRTCYDS